MIRFFGGELIFSDDDRAGRGADVRNMHGDVNNSFSGEGLWRVVPRF
jgi:hypothetical protein